MCLATSRSPARPLTITAADRTKVYGAGLPALTASYSGFVNGDTLASLTTQPTLTTAATASSPVSGSPYSITVSGAADGNYTISYVAGALSVTPAPLTIAADNASIVAGQPIPSFNANYSGFVLGQGPGVLNGSLTINTSASPDSPAGSYPIVPGGLSSANYAIAYVGGTLSVMPGSGSQGGSTAPLVTVGHIEWQTVKAKGKKSTKVLEVFFSGALSANDADNAQAYVLDSATKSKKLGTRYTKLVPFKTASYNSSTNMVTLTPRGTIPTQKMQLTINASLIQDARGRQLDGNADGRPGGNYVSLPFSSHGVISPALPSVRARAVSAMAIDAMIADGSFSMINPMGHDRHRRVR